MAGINPKTPEEKEIEAAFIKNLEHLVDRYTEQIEASKHGESDPEFAQIFEGLVKLAVEYGPVDMAIYMQASMNAAVETVLHDRINRPRG